MVTRRPSGRQDDTDLPGPLARWVARLGLAGLLFAGGLAFGTFNLQPGPLLREAVKALKDIRYYTIIAYRNEPREHMALARNDGAGVTLAAPDRMQPGLTLISGLFGNRLGFRLVAADGSVVWDWPIDFFTIAPDEMRHRFHALIHGEHLFPNGEIVANLDGRGMVRFDRCGRILWRNHDETHHSIFVDHLGFLWAPKHGPAYPRGPLIGTAFSFDRIGKFDPGTGALVEEIDLVAALVASDRIGLIQQSTDRFDDVAHVNDVEVLSPALAPAFPSLRAGDILVSARNLHQLWILDGTTHLVKWTFSGPMIGQHDPDFEADGTITVYDNRPGGGPDGGAALGEYRGRSRILSVNPATDAVRTIYQGNERNAFYSAYRGKHERQPNGNLLITESDGGRVFEATPDGEPAWSWTNRYDDTRVGWVMGAARVPESYGAAFATPCE
jgi:hypothetical protein